MCGITILLQTAHHSGDMHAALQAMGQAQAHRGPDAADVAIVRDRGACRLGFGHQRLSIFDLSAAGNQPMVSPDGRWQIVFNGEIFNHTELRAEMGQSPILDISSGDTAVLLEALVRWGPDALHRLNGMWAFALYDAQEESLLISRDRMGIKPLQYRIHQGRMAMASEIKAVLAAEESLPAINPRAVRDYLQRGRTNHDHETFFEGVYAVPAGTWAKIDLRQADAFKTMTFTPFWQHPFTTDAPLEPLEPEALRAMFFDAVNQHMRADVPVGITLSGGLDSAAILAGAKALFPQADLNALSVISDDPKTSEEPFQKIMVDATGCHWQRFNISDDPHDVLARLTDAAWHSDAPPKSFADVGLMTLCQQARDNGIIVLLNGQGADEQLGGYKKYLFFRAAELMRQGHVLAAAQLLGGFWRNGTVINQFRLAEAKRYMPGAGRQPLATPMTPALAQTPIPPLLTGRSYRAVEFNDMTRNSVPMLLHAEDRMSMASSLEMRVPFLDHRLVDMLARTGPDQKLAKGWTKAVFRDAMSGVVPEAIVRRKDKKGFTLPQEDWLRGALKTPVQSLFSGQMRSVDAGLIDRDALQAMFARFQAGDRRIGGREMLRYVALEHWLEAFDGKVALSLAA